MNNLANDLQLAVWGPTNSGKTWLLRALAKELAWYNKHDDKFNYHLTRSDGRRVIAMPPTPNPSQGIEDKAYKFHRTSKGNSVQQRISAQAHNIILRDNKGSDLVDALEGKNRQAAVSLANADGVIALLEANFQRLPGGAAGIVTNEIVYATLLQDLCELLISKSLPNNHPRFLALCITKFDRLKTISNHGEDTFNTFFGGLIPEVLASYRDRLNVNIFNTSAVGYCHQGRRIVPNLEPRTGNILRPDSWHPFNTAAPFFWIFETIERKRLGSERTQMYISYPNVRRYPIPARY